MITLNSVSGGRSSGYLFEKYPADHNVFSVVCCNKKTTFKDKTLQRIANDRFEKSGFLQMYGEAIGILEMEETLLFILELEQRTGREISWVRAESFDDLTKGKFLPNMFLRACTSKLKVKPMFQYWYANIGEPVEQRFGFRAGELRRAQKMMARTNAEGLAKSKFPVEKHTTGLKKGKWKWAERYWYCPRFPLLEDHVTKMDINLYWKKRSKIGEYENNCVGCFHRSPVFLHNMSKRSPEQFQWFIEQEEKTGLRWKTGFSYERIKNMKIKPQTGSLFDNIGQCDTGFCGL